MDETRIGQKGRLQRVWWQRGHRPRRARDTRYRYVYLYGAFEPKTGRAFGLVLPRVNAEAMQVWLDAFADQLEPDEHAAVVLDGAAWHKEPTIKVPDGVTLIIQPPYAPEVQPAESAWRVIKERDLSNKVFKTIEDVVNAVCCAWNRFIDDPRQVRSATHYPWLKSINL